MLIRTPPPSAPPACPDSSLMATTFPSAGARTTPGSSEPRRSGSRKKPAKAAVKRTQKKNTPIQPTARATRAAAKAVRTQG